MFQNNNNYIRSFTGNRYRKKSGDDKVLNEKLPMLSIASDQDFNMIKSIKFKKIIFEIGTGCGDFLVGYATNNKDVFCIGSDVYSGGIIKTAKKIFAANISNIRLFSKDGRVLLDNLPNEFIDEMYILFPDPWPKRKQHNRRIINSEYITHIVDKLKPNGIIVIATDVENYQDHIRCVLKNVSVFSFKEFNDSDVVDNIPFYVQTKYHKKAILNERKSIFFVLSKL